MMLIKQKEILEIDENVNRWIKQCDKPIWGNYMTPIGEPLKIAFIRMTRKAELIKIKEHIRLRQYEAAVIAYKKFIETYPEFK